MNKKVEPVRAARERGRGTPHRLIAAMSLSICATLIGSTAAAATATVPYGVIEIGAKGIKAYIFDIDRAARDPACAQEGDAYLKCIDPKTIAQINCNTIDDPSFMCTVGAVKTFWDQFNTQYSIPANHIYLVGSSSLSDELKRDQLVGQISHTLKLVNQPDFVNVEQEATFALQGVLGMLPDNVRKMRANQAVTIDIGSGNLKGAYQSLDGGQVRMVDFGVGFGTKVAADAINKMRKTESFISVADTWRTTEFLPKLRSELDNKQGVGNRNRVYLTGGIVWAMEVLAHPDDKTKFTRVNPKDIDLMLARAGAPDAAATLCGDSRKQQYPEIAKVCDTFSVNQLVGGLEILKGLANELNFVVAKKNIFFFRDALYAWPLGYTRNKLYGSAVH